MPSVEGRDGLAVVFNNAGANKLDVYLEREVDYDATVDTTTGATTATATVTLTNRGPSSGLPDGVIGNYTGDAPGSNRILVSLYSVLPVTSASVRTPDGEVSELPGAGRHRGRLGDRIVVHRRPARRIGHADLRTGRHRCRSTTATRSPCARSRS